MSISHLSNQKVLEWLGERFRATRLSQNITMVDLAEKAGITERTLYNLENGTKSVGLLNVVAVLRALGKLEELDQFLPAPPPRAEALVQIEKLQAKTRQRASRSGQSTHEGSNKKPWTWGDD
ncbi:helix-turn-helix domain-containing protein [Ketobacter alkanivorans]|jgi:transcriptional regulator with XRE-family HTH domain|uniref:HTH cro/C1-type domain-containing protein n=1 Tax=Ketobacter alkanivorans TaxID=1917421 RepID=A0A2K9LFT5_9GAMM|nr:helix-turn-helix transcriptional regulator [Ketobacter alkanivorans]MAR91055.1 transcriptional regulator [Pseudomonadales bacterium]MCP5015747.1 helix-turn-helix transcriptional regulator [Ketobacter sp.]HAG92598.1 XRE family transcriptional regulator [Gammaproteobacteria bacterium]AUM11031.1 hypothetical protein Kalk_00615 [Ketobacter alkanivorans]HAU15988.1 XRE family transcriptional regulator [Gammaproteobacteria bacterium]|tara:strand:+ start:14159 stop:14524 length:366 start_codon:yes stop_codon:yes gene_type:complete